MTTWLAAGAAVLAGVVAIAAVVLSTHKSAPAAHASESLRLDPGEAHVRSRATAGGGRTASALSGGDYSTCALVQGNAVDCWGDDAYGQLGDGSKNGALSPVRVRFGRKASQLSAGGSHACAVLADATVACWGANAHGELGNGARADSPTPVPVAGIHGATAVAAGVAHTCALLQDGSVRCWGANGNGELGNGTTADSVHSVAVQGLGPVKALTAGLAHTCALLTDGTVKCWGSNANGELGNGLTVDSAVPVAVTGLAGEATAIDAGDAHTCALLADGAIQCWGWNIEGQLGNGGGSDSPSPVDVQGLRGAATALSAGGSHTCALMRSGGVECWGANLYGQLGNGTTSDSASPVPVSGLQNGVIAITAGLYHACAVLSGGSVTCWGWNEQGQLGNGTTTSASSPVGVARLGLAPDGTGTVVVNPRSVPGSLRNVTLAFTYTVAAGGMHDGALAVTAPFGWSIPSTNPSAPGFSTASTGRVITTGRTISVTGLTLGSGAQVVVTYGNTFHGGPGARPMTSGTGTWRVREQSSSSGNLSLLKASPVVHVLAADGSGVLVTTTTVVPNGAKGQSLVFDYAADAGGVDGGTLTLVVPPGWSPPSTGASDPGYTSSTRGSVAVLGRTISVIGITLASGKHMQITYAGAHAPATNVGTQTWESNLRASPAGKLRALAGSPQITVLAPNGSGNVYGFQSTVANGSRGVAVSFTYQADNGGIKDGAVSFTVPKGWSPPSTRQGDPGYVTSSEPKLTVQGRTITVPLKELSSGSTIHVTYGTGQGANAPLSNVGPQEWVVKERSTSRGPMKALEKPPTITVLSADGSGSLVRATGPVAAGSSGNTLVFVYEAAPGGLQDGTLQLTVPDGWSGPSTGTHDAGYVTATSGAIDVSGNTITLSHVWLSSGATLTVIYGNRSGGGPGATAPKGKLGPTVWKASERSATSGTLKPLR